MKLASITFPALLATFAFTSSAFAQTELNLSITNAAGPELAIPGGEAAVAQGVAVRVGLVGAGADLSSLTGVLAMFTEFGSATVGDGVGADGLLSAVVTVPDTQAGIETTPGQQLSVVVGDDDGAFAIFTSPDFVTEEFVGGATPRNTVDVAFDNANITFQAGTLVPASGFLAPALPTIQLAAVPEPSAVLLAGFGLIGLVARRRR